MLTIQGTASFGDDMTVPDDNLTITAPVIPEDVPLRCTYDARLGAWRCNYASWWRQPAVYGTVIAAVAAFGLGFVLGTSPKIRTAVGEARKVVR